MKFSFLAISAFLAIGLSNCKPTADPDLTTQFVGQWTATTNSTSNTATTSSLTKGTTLFYIERLTNDKVKIKSSINNAIKDTDLKTFKVTNLTISADFTLADVRIINDKLSISESTTVKQTLNNNTPTNNNSVMTGSGTISGGKLIISLSVTEGSNQAYILNFEFTK